MVAMIIIFIITCLIGVPLLVWVTIENYKAFKDLERGWARRFGYADEKDNKKNKKGK